MKQKKIMLFFFLALPVSIGLRFLQLYFTIDAKTGFYLNKTGNYGPVLLILILLCALFTGIFAYFTFKRPENPPKGNIWLSICSVLLGISIFVETLFQHTSSLVFWQASLLKISGIAMAVFLVIYALKGIIKLKIPNILATIPVIYLIARMICDFTAIAKLALISDNIILILAYCVTLLFFLSFAKLYNNTDTETEFKKMLSLGLSSVILCFANSVPSIVVNIISKGSYIHTPIKTTVTILFFGIFILSFILSHFFRKNS